MDIFRRKARELEHGLTGSALALFAGDALGAPVEGMDGNSLSRDFGWVSEMLSGGRFQPGTYTDDTQLMIGQLEALAEDDSLSPGSLAKTYAANYQHWRGYGSSTGEALKRLGAGEIGLEELSRPSYGNGGAMGIAPLGVYFQANLEKVCQRAEAACRVTHHHPEALSGAIAVACCSALLARRGLAGKAIEFGELVSSLRAVPALKDAPMTDPLAWLADLTKLVEIPPSGRAELLAKTFGSSLRAIESVPLAIGAALSASSLREAIEVAVNAGGDSDTQGAMAGGMAGAYHGAKALPESWLKTMENRGKGLDYVKRLTRKLAGTMPRPKN